MGNLGQKLDYLAATKAAIGAEITTRGGNITGAAFKDYPAKIGALEEFLTPLLLDLEDASVAQKAVI
ncbi:MAG: hypothetical protein RRY64_01190 [Oscillospiraceae bacterium]